MIVLTAALVLSSHAPALDAPSVHQGGQIKVTVGAVAEALHPIAFAPAPSGSKVLMCMEDGGVRILDTRTHETIRELDKHPQPAYAAAWSADGAEVATGDETARIWVASAVSGQKLREFRTHIRGIEKLSFNHDRTMLMSTGKDDVISEYDLEKSSSKAAEVILGKGLNFYGATYHPLNPDLFVTGFLGVGGGREYASNGHVLGFINGHDNQGAYDVAYNPQGTMFATAGRDGTAMVWNAKTLKKIGTLKGHGDWVMAVAFSPNGKLIATSSTDRTVKIWNAYNLEKVADLPNQSSVGSPLCFTSDGRTLLTVNDGGSLEYNAISPSQPPVGGSRPAPKTKHAKPRKKRHHG